MPVLYHADQPSSDIVSSGRATPPLSSSDEGRRTPPLSRGGYPQCYAQYAQNTPTPSRKPSKSRGHGGDDRHGGDDMDAKASAAARAKAAIEAAAAQHPGWSVVSAQIAEKERATKQVHKPAGNPAPARQHHQAPPEDPRAKAVALHNLPPYQAYALYAARARAHARALPHHAPPQNLKHLHQVVEREWERSSNTNGSPDMHELHQNLAMLNLQAMQAMQDDQPSTPQEWEANPSLGLGRKLPSDEGTPRLAPGAILGWDAAKYAPAPPGLENTLPSTFNARQYDMPVMNRKPLGQSREDALRSAAAAAVGDEKHGQALPLSPLFGMSDGLGVDLGFLDESPKRSEPSRAAWPEHREALRAMPSAAQAFAPSAPAMPPMPNFFTARA